MSLLSKYALILGFLPMEKYFEENIRHTQMTVA